ncbi:DUF4333 domain-containing protein [Pseudonocardia halophobica]|uniref:DUF4333 domain-containing protein n=1 Tax=Pseudonocardia halophobica TaxID=29401 RepID=UPI003D94A865
MSTPRDPHGETDRGHRAAGGQGDATGPDPSAGTDRDTYGAPYGTGTAGAESGDATDDSASRTVPHTGRSGWDFTSSAEADPPTPAYGSPAVEYGDTTTGTTGAGHDATPSHGSAPESGDTGGSEWSAAGGSGWSSGAQGEGVGWDPAGTADWDPEGTRGPSGGSWDPRSDDRTAAHPAPGGWDPAGAGIGGAASATSTLPGGESRASRRRGRSGGGGKKLIAGAAVLVAVLAVLAVTAFWQPGFLVTEEFDQQALQAGVTRILTQDYGLGATGVSCPEGQKVEAGTTFTCSANVDGEAVEVPVTVLDDRGTYQVGRV